MTTSWPRINELSGRLDTVSDGVTARLGGLEDRVDGVAGQLDALSGLPGRVDELQARLDELSGQEVQVDLSGVSQIASTTSKAKSINWSNNRLGLARRAGLRLPRKSKKLWLSKPRPI